MSEILRQILDSLDDDAPVRGVGVFRHAAAVVSRGAGVAYGFWARSGDGPASAGSMRRFEGKSARKLADLALSSDPVEASVGVAAINSLIEPSDGRIIERNGYELALERAEGRRLAVVGHFAFIEKIRERVGRLWVLELDPQKGDLPVEKAPEVIPEADVVVITGATLVNHTADGLLSLARGKDIIMMGPTTIMSPILFDYGILAICGVVITDPLLAISHLREGGGMRDLAGMRRICLVR